MSLKPVLSVGVLGGMGPAASADFYHLLVDIAQHAYGADQDTDFPEMYIYSLPLSGFDETGVTDPESVRGQLVKGITKLAGLGSGVIAVPCNTVHAYFDDMQKASNVPIISIIEAVADEVVARGYSNVGLLTSESTRKLGLYEHALSIRNIISIQSSDDEQRILNQAIHHVMSGAQGLQDVSALKSIVNRLKSEGAQAIVLGCTEIPLALRQEHSELPLLNSTDILARATLKKAYGA